MKAYRRALRATGSVADDAAIEEHIWSVAKHEAAHAVVAVVALGSRPTRITIVPESSLLGCMVPDNLVSPSVEKSLRRQRDRRVMVALAGKVVNLQDGFFDQPYRFQRKYFAQFVQRPRDDISRALALLESDSERADDEDGDVWRRLLWLARRTHLLLSLSPIRAMVCCVGDELLKRPTLEGRELDAWAEDLMEFRHAAWRLLKQREVVEG